MVPLGLGAIGSAYFSNMTKYKPLFVLLTAGLFILSYRLIEKNNSSRATRIIFWVSALISVLIIYSPTILAWIAR
ncbi:MAG: hypothetical protein ACOXZT_05355 [Tissierellaceae bacterium]|nr:hypothetical protein [Tissierellia bacterium]